MTALAAFKNYERDQVAARKAFANRADIQDAIADFKRDVKSLTTTEDLLEDSKTLGFVLKAFGLESELSNPGKLKAVINSDPDDINSFANRLSDTRFGELAAFLDTPEFGLGRLRLSDKQGQLIDKYLTNEFEKSIGQQNPAARDALFFLRRIGSVENSFQILADLPLRSIVTDALNLPAEIARQSVDKQASLIEAKLDIDALRTTSLDSASKSALDLLNEDRTALGAAKKQITAAQNIVDGFVTQLETLRASIEDLPNVTDPAGVNSAEITVQEAALPDLLRQHGLVASAEIAVKDTRTAIDKLNALFNQARNAEDADELTGLQDEFTEIADAILGDSGYINAAIYNDPNSGQTQNILRNGTGGALPAGIDATASQISTEVATDGTRAITNSTDLADFLTDLQNARDAFASASFATLSSDLDAAEADFDTAETAFDSAEFLVNVNVSSLLNAFNNVDFAKELDSASLSTGLSSVDDALSRIVTIENNLEAIRQLGLDAQEAGADLTAINDEYADRLADLTEAINTAGSITDGTTTVTFDNLLTDSTLTYDVFAGTQVQAEGGDLASSILAGLPGSITAGNAATLVSDIEDTYTPEVDDLENNLTRDRRVLYFANNTADPQGALDSQIRQLRADLDASIAEAEVDGKNLLSSFATDLKISLGSLGAVLTVDAQNDFEDSFSSALEGYETTVLSGGDVDARIQALNDALFAAGRTASALKAETSALNIQIGIVDEKKTLIEGEGGAASDFFKPIEFTTEARKFIERYLIQKDIEAAGGSVNPAGTSADQLLAGQIGSILPSGGLGFNVLA